MSPELRQRKAIVKADVFTEKMSLLFHSPCMQSGWIKYFTRLCGYVNGFPTKNASLPRAKAYKANVLIKSRKNSWWKKFMRSSSPSLCHPGKNVPQNGPWWILSSHSLNKNKKNILRLSRIVDRRCTRLSVFVVLNSTTCLVKLNLIFHFFGFFCFFTEIEFGIGCEHNAQLDNEGEGEGSCCSPTQQQMTENSEEVSVMQMFLWQSWEILESLTVHGDRGRGL